MSQSDERFSSYCYTTRKWVATSGQSSVVYTIEKHQHIEKNTVYMINNLNIAYQLKIIQNRVMLHQIQYIERVSGVMISGNANHIASICR